MVAARAARQSRIADVIDASEGWMRVVERRDGVLMIVVGMKESEEREEIMLCLKEKAVQRLRTRTRAIAVLRISGPLHLL